MDCSRLGLRASRQAEPYFKLILAFPFRSLAHMVLQPNIRGLKNILCTPSKTFLGELGGPRVGAALAFQEMPRRLGPPAPRRSPDQRSGLLRRSHRLCLPVASTFGLGLWAPRSCACRAWVRGAPMARALHTVCICVWLVLWTSSPAWFEIRNFPLVGWTGTQPARRTRHGTNSEAKCHSKHIAT